MIPVLRKIRFLLTPAERRGALILLGLMVVGMTLEMLCQHGHPGDRPHDAAGPRQDLSTVSALARGAGHPDPDRTHPERHAGLGIYLIKNLFLTFLAWRQTRYAFGVQVQLSQRLFTAYLRQPYTFHLQRNSAQLIRNVTGEVAVFTDAIVSILNITTEFLVLLGISTLLLAIEPAGR
jgi:hypothetical protein